MEISKGFKWGITGVILVGLTSLGLYMYNQYNLLVNGITNAFKKKPSLGKINNISLTNINITLIYLIQNLGILSAEVTEQDYDITINGKFVVKIKNKETILIKSKGISKFPLNINFTPKDLINAGVNNIQSILIPEERKNFVIRVKGTFSYESGALLGKNYPLDISFTLADLIS